MTFPEIVPVMETLLLKLTGIECFTKCPRISAARELLLDAIIPIPIRSATTTATTGGTTEVAAVCKKPRAATSTTTVANTSGTSHPFRSASFRGGFRPQGASRDFMIGSTRSQPHESVDNDNDHEHEHEHEHECDVSLTPSYSLTHQRFDIPEETLLSILAQFPPPPTDAPPEPPIQSMCHDMPYDMGQPPPPPPPSTDDLLQRRPS
jgi:hypothetical protein